MPRIVLQHSLGLLLAHSIWSWKWQGKMAESVDNEQADIKLLLEVAYFPTAMPRVRGSSSLQACLET